jgi:thiamine-phosphate pyrophosphorylase
MAESCLLYYITDRAAFPGDERGRRRCLVDKIAEAAIHGVDYIQLREKDLPIRELESLAREVMQIILEQTTESREPRTVLLINSRTDVALSAGADGVHLQSNDILPQEVRAAWRTGAYGAGEPLIGVSCHSPQEAVQAAANQAAFAVLAPVFEKKDAAATKPAGLDALSQASDSGIPVLALGGVTLQNAESCLRAGAAGIAAIRLFQENDIATIVSTLRG